MAFLQPLHRHRAQQRGAAMSDWSANYRHALSERGIDPAASATSTARLSSRPPITGSHRGGCSARPRRTPTRWPGHFASPQPRPSPHPTGLAAPRTRWRPPRRPSRCWAGWSRVTGGRGRRAGSSASRTWATYGRRHVLREVVGVPQPVLAWLPRSDGDHVQGNRQVSSAEAPARS